jgi:hypothetical protein
MTIVGVLIGTAILGIAALLFVRVIGSHAELLASSQSKTAFERVESVVLGPVVGRIRQSLAAASGALPVTVGAIRTKLTGVSGSKIQIQGGDLELQVVRPGLLVPLPSTNCNNAKAGTEGRCLQQLSARTRCNGGVRLRPPGAATLRSAIYGCMLAVFTPGPDTPNSDLSFGPGRPVFVEFFYRTKDLTTDTPLFIGPGGSFYAASSATKNGATIYYAIYWEKVNGSGASFHVYQGQSNVSQN